ncbi:uncharacterized protein LOC135115210 isoform X2 [Scylla paramamosain]|uniref:uncharacterized protein LOC135115210 isoform X2 n=1 Tax=Scylla paramamosain TaxID=85552 RepID=UPI0030837388
MLKMCQEDTLFLETGDKLPSYQDYRGQQLDEQARYAKMERRRQEKVTLGDSLGRSSSRRCGAGLEKGERQAKSLIKGPIRLRSFNWNTNIGSSDATHAVSQATNVIHRELAKDLSTRASDWMVWKTQ